MKESNNNHVPLYNSRIVDNYIKLIKKRYQHINIPDLLKSAKMTSYEIADEGHWFSQHQINLFHKNLSIKTNNVNIAREAGRYAASPEALGAMRQYMLGLVGPANAYELAGKAAEKFTRSSTYKSTKLASNKVQINVTLREGIIEKPFQCENRIGFFEAMSMIFANKLPRIEHPECVFKGGKTCRYIITWEKSFADLWKRIRNYMLIPVSLGCLVSIFISPIMAFSAVLPVSVLFLLLLTSISDRIEKKELVTSLNHLRDSSDQLLEKIEVNYNNALMTNEIGLIISKHTKKEDILKSVIEVSQKRLDFDRGMILLANPEKSRLLFQAGFGYTEAQRRIANDTEFHLDNPGSKGIFVRSFYDQKPFLINDISEIEEDLSPRSMAFVKAIGTKSFVCCPIVCEGESLGILAVDNLRSKRPLIQSDISLLLGISSILGVSIRNAELIEAREEQFRSLLQTLAASIDARDPLTAGHSERVTEFALGICDELKLDDEYRDTIRVAALLHDYGKIGVPDAILMKPRRLDKNEFEIVKTHSEKTRLILKEVNFQGIFSQVPEIAGAHHEKIDGSGYPNGLIQDEIPLGAKIIAVADFFEAITAKRHYRGPMPFEKAVSLLLQERGLHFETEIVDAFMRYYTGTHNIDYPYPMASTA